MSHKNCLEQSDSKDNFGAFPCAVHWHFHQHFIDPRTREMSLAKYGELVRRVSQWIVSG